MGWLFVLLTAVALLIFALLPFWVGFGYAVVIAWSGWLLYLIFLRSDSLAREIRGQAEPNRDRR